MGGRVGEILMRNAEWTAHPISTVDPSKMASAPASAPIRLGQDLGKDKLSGDMEEDVAGANEPLTP